MFVGLTTEIDRLAEVDPHTLADAESVVGLHRLQDRLDAVLTRVVAAYDAKGDWETDGALSLASWISTRCHRPLSAAKRQVRLGRILRHMPLVEQAWLAGLFGEAQVAALARARRPETEKAFERDEHLLVAGARDLRFATLCRRLSYWAMTEDRDGAEAEAQSQRDQRAVYLSESFQGMWFGNLTFDPVSGTIINTELKRLEQELFDADWAEARERLGDAASVFDLTRTPAQRRADAMVEMAIRSATAPADGRRPEPLFSVLVGFETFAGPMCELASGIVVTPGSLVPWLDKAWIERVVFDGPSRAIDVGVQRRIFTGATRRAIEVRDRECFHPYCETPAEDCQADHIEPYSEGGLTVEQNGRMACPKHNRNRHRRT
jgi:hypothetical protein